MRLETESMVKLHVLVVLDLDQLQSVYSFSVLPILHRVMGSLQAIPGHKVGDFLDIVPTCDRAQASHTCSPTHSHSRQFIDTNQLTIHAFGLQKETRVPKETPKAEKHANHQATIIIFI